MGTVAPAPLADEGKGQRGAQVDEKCYHLMAPILGASRSRKLCDAVWNIEKVGNITKLRNLLTA
jgi:hypothetical protein